MSMKVIHKYRLVRGRNDSHWYIDIPTGSKILDIGAQGLDFMVWALRPVEDTAKVTRHHYLILSTGQAADVDDYVFCKRIEVAQHFVYHAFMGRCEDLSN